MSIVADICMRMGSLQSGSGFRAEWGILVRTGDRVDPANAAGVCSAPQLWCLVTAVGPFFCLFSAYFSVRIGPIRGGVNIHNGAGLVGPNIGAGIKRVIIFLRF